MPPPAHFEEELVILTGDCEISMIAPPLAKHVSVA
jgi:hypothetical protein